MKDNIPTQQACGSCKCNGAFFAQGGHEKMGTHGVSTLIWKESSAILSTHYLHAYLKKDGRVASKPGEEVGFIRAMC
eukprot:650287-Pelagomonas_calceolata.AAC.6